MEVCNPIYSSEVHVRLLDDEASQAKALWLLLRHYLSTL